VVYAILKPGQLGNPEEGEYLPLEDVTRSFVRT
jgi:hypothetical protein